MVFILVASCYTFSGWCSVGRAALVNLYACVCVCVFIGLPSYTVRWSRCEGPDRLYSHVLFKFHHLLSMSLCDCCTERVASERERLVKHAVFLRAVQYVSRFLGASVTPAPVLSVVDH